MKIISTVIGLSFTVWSWFLPEKPFTQADGLVFAGMFMVWIPILIQNKK